MAGKNDLPSDATRFSLLSMMDTLDYIDTTMIGLAVFLRFSLLILGFVLMSFDLAQASEKWPPLPSRDFIKGRSAHKADVDSGRAVFVLDDNGKIVGQPIKIAIPQYGYFKKDKVFVIVIQAERAPDGQQFVGARTFDGKAMVGFLGEVKLLGTTGDN